MTIYAMILKERRLVGFSDKGRIQPIIGAREHLKSLEGINLISRLIHIKDDNEFGTAVDVSDSGIRLACGLCPMFRLAFDRIQTTSANIH